MNKLTFIALIGTAVFVTGCSGKGQQTENGGQTTAMQVDLLLDEADGRVDSTVTVEGLCTHICRHGGKKIFLMGSDDTRTIRVEAVEKIGSFKQEAVNSIVEVTGVLKEQRIDETYLANWEERLKAQTEEEHGESGGAGCTHEQKARNESAVNTAQERIDNFRHRIAERKGNEGKDYLSFYFIEADSYTLKTEE